MMGRLTPLSTLLLLAVCFLGMVAPSTAAAQEPLYAHPEEIADYWGRIVGLSLAAMSACLILYVLWFRRHRLGEATSRLMLFLGICVIPMPLSLLGTAVGMEKSKRVEFCSSCHVMDPFIDDMRDVESGTLAAVHFKNRYIQREQCFACHSNYGIFGTIEAKNMGLRHIWKDATGTYEVPVRIHAPYDWTICLGCHLESKKFTDFEFHADVLPEILEPGDNEDPLTCIECHGAPHPPREERAER